MIGSFCSKQCIDLVMREKHFTFVLRSIKAMTVCVPALANVADKTMAGKEDFEKPKASAIFLTSIILEESPRSNTFFKY